MEDKKTALLPFEVTLADGFVRPGSCETLPDAGSGTRAPRDECRQHFRRVRRGRPRRPFGSFPCPAVPKVLGSCGVEHRAVGLICCRGLLQRLTGSDKKAHVIQNAYASSFSLLVSELACVVRARCMTRLQSGELDVLHNRGGDWTLSRWRTRKNQKKNILRVGGHTGGPCSP